MRKTPLKTQKGFSILEALVSLGILAFGVMAVITMLDTSFWAGRLSKDYTQCLDLATYLIEEMRYQVTSEKNIGGVDDNKLNTYDNDGTSDIVMDTDLAPPISDPGKQTFERWSKLLKERFQGGRGVVRIVRYDPDYANNTSVKITIEWPGTGLRMLDKSVSFETVLH